MSEIRLIVVLLICIVCASAAGQVLPAQVIAVGFLAISNVINLGIGIINIIQAIKRDGRFLHAGYLGLITMGIGALLLLLFGSLLGAHPYTYWAAVPYFVSGLLTLAVVLAM